MRYKKLVATAEAAAVLFSMFTLCSCTSKKAKSGIYSDDTPWFKVEYSDIVAQEGNNSLLVYAGQSNGNYVFVKNIDYPEPDNAKPGDEFSNEYHDTKLIICDANLVPVKQIELNDELYRKGHNELSCGYFYTNWGYSTDEKIVLCGDYLSMGSYENWTVNIDPSSYEISVKTSEYKDVIYEKYSDSEAFGIPRHMDNGINYDVGTLVKGESCTVAIALYDKAGKAHITEASSFYPTVSAYDICDPIMTDNDHAMAKLKTYGESEEYWVELNFSDSTVSAYKEDMAYLKDVNLENIVYTPSSGCLSLSDEGITKIDTAAKTSKQVFSFDWCNIDRSLINDLEVLNITDDSIILYGTNMVVMQDHSVRYDSVLMKLSKCDTNPNVGKKIITLASLDDMDPAIAKAVCDFNETNKDYFLKVINDYNAKDYGVISSKAVAAEADKNIEMEVAGKLQNEFDPALNDFYLGAESTMSNRLIVDLLAGEGPDIILNGASYNQLYNDEYLVDMSSYLANSNVKLVGNIEQISKTDGKLYQIPLTFTVSGLEVTPDAVKPGQKGFTFEQYAEFVNGPCNGTDPMMMTKLDFLTAVIRTQPGLFINGGKVDFNNDAFKEACKYANTCVFDPVDQEKAYAALDKLKGGYRTISDFMGMVFSTTIVQGNTFVGTPSSDGSGPVANIKCSAAIAAKSANKDGCWQFIEYLLSDTVLSTVSGGIPVTESAFEATCKFGLEDYKGYYETWNESERSRLGLVAPDESLIDTYRNIVYSADRKNITDSSVMIIMREEVQAYFAGDKNLDEVIEIINSRAKTYYSERG
jgi:ABC-type glycerol-3-phosphate transport system substrate-binding protein